MTEKRKVKARTTKKVKETKESLERDFNLGVQVELTFGEYTIRELAVIPLIRAVKTGLMAIAPAIGDKENLDDIQLIAKLVDSEEAEDELCKIFALYCDELDYTKFKNLKFSDLNKLIKAVKEVTDFSEIKDIFFQLNLQKYLKTPISTEISAQ